MAVAVEGSFEDLGLDGEVVVGERGKEAEIDDTGQALAPYDRVAVPGAQRGSDPGGVPDISEGLSER